MTAECGVIYSAGEALCRRKSILQHRVNPSHSGTGVSQEVRNIRKSRKVSALRASDCLEYETCTYVLSNLVRPSLQFNLLFCGGMMLDSVNPRGEISFSLKTRS